MKEPLVLLPDMMCDARLFAPQIAAFSRDTAVMVAPITGGERIEEISSDLLSVLPAKFALAGAGMGGAIAMELLRRAPDRITRIALIATTPLAETPQEAAAREPQMIAAKTGRLGEILRERLKAAGIGPGAGRMPALNMALSMGADLGAEIFVRQSRAMQRRRDQQTVLQRCAIPALVLCGAHDTVTPVKRHVSMADFLPAAELVVIDAAGHLPSLETPEETTEALADWLKRPGAARR
ncbi:MAG: alpha/beta fold hydrolase [Rhodobacterales bacterium]|uniref:alpha/beta fold hydrolase n=1 Tax=Puniceibacterium antarcticum TaxID=1206336 RepID=UPI000C176B20|nr:alpha/beta hydrolase [Puniceibacterium antarcticum]